MSEWSNAKLCDVANLLLGMILFFSPWLFGLSAGTPWQAGIPWQTTSPTIGLLIALLSMAALAAFAVWEEWLNLVAGLCLVLSPWFLGFQNRDAMTLHVVIGSIGRLWHRAKCGSRTPARETTAAVDRPSESGHPPRQEQTGRLQRPCNATRD